MLVGVLDSGAKLWGKSEGTKLVCLAFWQVFQQHLSLRFAGVRHTWRIQRGLIWTREEKHVEYAHEGEEKGITPRFVL